MKSARSQQPPLPPLLRQRRRAVPDFQAVDFPAESDSLPVSSEDESECYVSNEDDNSVDDEGEGYDSDLKYDKPICDSYFQQFDESKEVDFSTVTDSPPVNEEIDSSEDESEDYVSNEDDNSTDDKDECYVGNLRIVKRDYNSELEYTKAIWESYFQQAYESKGFDIKDYPGPLPLPTFYPLPRYLQDRKKYRMIKGYGERAIKKYNDSKGTDHVVERVLEVKGGGYHDYVYYLTFSVKAGDGKRGYIQAMVVKDQENNLDFPVVRPKGFDIKDYPGPHPLPIFCPLPRYLRDPKKYRILKGYGERAIKKYNDDKGTDYVVERVLEVMGGSYRDYVYDITFSVRAGDGKRDYIQAMVVKDQEDNLDFPVVRPRVMKTWELWCDLMSSHCVADCCGYA